MELITLTRANLNEVMEKTGKSRAELLQQLKSAESVNSYVTIRIGERFAG